jgi:integrase
VRHSLHQTAAGLVPGPLKTDQSRRSLELPKEAAGALIAWGAEQAEQRLAAGRHWHDTGLIFTDGRGKAVDRYRVQRMFRRACKAAGITRPDGSDFQLRESRHTFVSVLSASGVGTERISKAVSHVNSTVTRTVYLHQITDKISDAARVWDRLRSTREHRLPG